MSRLSRRIPVLLALAAFLAAQGGIWVHRTGHASEDAAHDAKHACPHGTARVHFCDPAPPHAHADDCAICTSVASRHAELPASSPLVVAVTDIAAAPPARSLPRTVPEAAPPLPRGPPA